MLNKNKREQANRANMLHRTEEYEIQHIMKTLSVPESMVREAMQAVGNNREKIEEFLRDKKSAG